jgi:hypothetical protein
VITTRYRIGEGSRLAFQLIENLVYPMAKTLPGLRQTTPDAGYRIRIIGYVPIRCRIERDGFGLPLEGQDKRPASLLHALYQP